MSSRRFFFSLKFNPNIIVINIAKLVQMIFSVWFGYFRHVTYHGTLLIVCKSFLILITINFNCYTWQRSTVQREIFSMKFHKLLLTQLISRSTFSTLHRFLFFFFLHFSCVFTFLEIIKCNMPKMLHFPSTFNIKMVTLKFINFDTF